MESFEAMTLRQLRDSYGMGVLIGGNTIDISEFS